MRHLTVYVTVLVFALLSEVAANGSSSDEREQDDPCSQFKMRVMAPPDNIDFKLKIIRTFEDVDYKLRIFNPCKDTIPKIVVRQNLIPQRGMNKFFKIPPFQFNFEPEKKD